MAKKALCIGINNYPGTGMDLQGCVNDATDWAGVLAERGFKVASLLDEQATKAAMLKAMSELIAKASKGDTLVIQDTQPYELPDALDPEQVVALPRGSLFEGCLGMLDRAGFDTTEPRSDSRALIFELEGLTIVTVRPSDVPIYVESGAADIGVTKAGASFGRT